MTPDGISQMSPHGPIPVFTYPSHPAPSYEHISPQLSTVMNLVYCLSCCHHPAHSCLGQPLWYHLTICRHDMCEITHLPRKWYMKFFLISDYWIVCHRLLIPPTEFRVLKWFTFHNLQYSGSILSSLDLISSSRQTSNSTVILEHGLYHNTITLRYSTNGCLYWLRHDHSRHFHEATIVLTDPFMVTLWHQIWLSLADIHRKLVLASTSTN